MGESTQEKKAKGLNNEIGGVVNDFKGADLSLPENYRSFSSGDMMGNINKTYGEGLQIGMDNINKSFNRDINRAESNAGERLMGQGLSKGSLFNNTVASAGDGLKGQKYSAIGGLTGELTARKGNSQLSVMDSTNRLDSGDAQFNALSQLRQYNAVLDGLNSKLGSISMMDNTTGWDDALAGLNTVGNVASGLSGIPGLFGSNKKD